MNPVIISTERLTRSPRALGDEAAQALTQQTRFADLPLPARLLLAVPRVRGNTHTAPLAERYVLDTLGRIIDAGPERRQTIEAVNLLAEVLLTPGPLDEPTQGADKQWLSSIENLVLCVLCKVRSGNTSDAAKLTQHWLSRSSLDGFNRAAVALCDSACFKRGGPHVFTPSWSGTVAHSTLEKHRSVIFTNELSLAESLLLNAIRLRMRTLRYSGISVRVVPLLRQHLALPNIEAVVDAHLIEALQHAATAPDIRCLCCADISADEAHFLASVAAFSSGDADLITRQLSAWLPAGPVERLLARTTEFKHISGNIGAALPLREWNIDELRNRGSFHKECEHISEPPMIH